MSDSQSNRQYISAGRTALASARLYVSLGSSCVSFLRKSRPFNLRDRLSALMSANHIRTGTRGSLNLGVSRIALYPAIIISMFEYAASV